MIGIDEFSDLLAKIYDSALDLDRWSLLLEALLATFDSQKSQLVYYRSLRDAHPFIRLCGFDLALVQEILPVFQELTPTDPRIPPLHFKAFHCRQLVSDDELHATSLYQRALRPMDIEYSMFFQLDLEDGGQCSVSVMRPADSGPYTANDCTDFGRLIPHISRAATIHGVLRAAHAAQEGALALIEDIPIGMLVLQNERVFVANGAARALLNEAGPLQVTGDRLRGTTPQARSALKSAMQELTDHPERTVGVSLGTETTGLTRVILRRLNVATADLLSARPGVTALYLADSRQPLETSNEVLRRLFGLTEREAEVLAALLQGHRSDAIAKQLGIGPETVKTHLQHIMQAVGVSRQVDLVRLVLSSPTLLGRWPVGSAPAGP